MSHRIMVLDESPKIAQELLQRLREEIPEEERLGWIPGPRLHEPSVVKLMKNPVNYLYPSKEPRATPLRELRDTQTQIELMRKADEKRLRKNKKRLENK